jgi:hypothetical protein
MTADAVHQNGWPSQESDGVRRNNAVAKADVAGEQVGADHLIEYIQISDNIYRHITAFSTRIANTSRHCLVEVLAGSGVSILFRYSR